MAALPDYFTLFGIAPTLSPDPAALRKKYYELSRQYHPDRYSAAEPGALAEVLKMSAQVNEGYRVLNDPDARLGYVLLLAEALQPDEHYKLPGEFLMEMMELNESVGNAAVAPEMRPEALDALQQAVAEWESGFAGLRTRYDQGERTESLIAALKDFYFRKKYLQRIKERLV